MIILHSSTTAVQIWIISHILHIYITVWQGKESPPPHPATPHPLLHSYLSFLAIYVLSRSIASGVLPGMWIVSFAILGEWFVGRNLTPKTAGNRA